MEIKNKTNYTQQIVLKDGSTVVARPNRTIILDEKLLSTELSPETWEVPVVEKKTNKGE